MGISCQIVLTVTMDYQSNQEMHDGTLIKDILEVDLTRGLRLSNSRSHQNFSTLISYRYLKQGIFINGSIIHLEEPSIDYDDDFSQYSSITSFHK